MSASVRTKHQVASIRRPTRPFVRTFVGQLARATPIGIDYNDIENAAAAALVRDLLTIRRKCRRGVVIVLERDPPRAAAIQSPHVNLWAARAVRGESKFSPLGAYRRADVDRRPFRQGADFAAAMVEQVKVRVSPT